MSGTGNNPNTVLQPTADVETGTLVLNPNDPSPFPQGDPGDEDPKHEQ